MTSRTVVAILALFLAAGCGEKSQDEGSVVSIEAVKAGSSHAVDIFFPDGIPKSEAIAIGQAHLAHHPWHAGITKIRVDVEENIDEEEFGGPLLVTPLGQTCIITKSGNGVLCARFGNFNIMLTDGPTTVSTYYDLDGDDSDD